MKSEPIEEFPPVPKQLLWMFNWNERKEATKMLHDYAASAIAWKPSKALLRAWEDVQNATDRARRLEDENENIRSLCRQLYEAERDKNQKDWTAVIQALEKIGEATAVLLTPNVNSTSRSNVLDQS